jgi:hypothetical protein
LLDWQALQNPLGGVTVRQAVCLLAAVLWIAGCATDLEKGDEQRLAGNYQEAIKLYERVEPDDAEYVAAKKGIADSYLKLGEAEFDNQNWQLAIPFYEKANTAEAKERIVSCNFALGEIEFDNQNWQGAISLYVKANTAEAKERIASCYFALGEAEFNNKNWDNARAQFARITTEHSVYKEAQEKIKAVDQAIKVENDRRQRAVIEEVRKAYEASAAPFEILEICKKLGPDNSTEEYRRQCTAYFSKSFLLALPGGSYTAADGRYNVKLSIYPSGYYQLNHPGGRELSFSGDWKEIRKKIVLYSTDRFNN